MPGHISATTSRNACVAAFTGRSAVDVTGRGTGIDDDYYARKVSVVERALQRQRYASGGLSELEVGHWHEHSKGLAVSGRLKTVKCQLKFATLQRKR